MKLSYKQKYKRIKKFVNFNYDLRNSENYFQNSNSKQKAEISKYFNILYGEPRTAKEQGVMNYDVYLYRPRSEKRKKIAAKYAQIQGGYSKLKVIPIPRAEEVPIKLVFKGNNLTVKEKNITRRIAFFNMTDLATNPKLEVLRVVKELDEQGKLDAILPLAGAREILASAGQSTDPEILADNIIALMQKYSENFQKWLFGLAGYEFENQSTFDEYKKARQKDKKSLSKKKRRCKKCKKVLTQRELKKKKCLKCKTLQ